MYRSSSHVQEQFTCTGAVHMYRSSHIQEQERERGKPDTSPSPLSLFRMKREGGGGERPDFDLFFIV